MNIYQRFEKISLRFPNKKALFYQREKLTYTRLREKIENLAASFYYSLGIRKGDKIAILLNNDSRYVMCLFAAFRLGAMAIPINTFLKAEELDYIFSDCSPDLLITSTEFFSVIGSLKEKMKSKIIVVDVPHPDFLHLKDLFEKRYAPAPDQQVDEEATAVICYTSSTTGRPKGAMLSHKNFITDVEGCLKSIEMNFKDRMLIFLPMFHSYTLTVCILIPLLIGATVYILSSLKHMSSAVRIIFLKRITILVGIPRIFKMFSKISVPKFLLVFCPVRFAISGADALAPEVVTVFKEKFNIPLLQGYGLTEASPVVSLNPLKKQKPGSIGLPLPNCEVKVVDDDERELPANTPGELIVKGPMVMKGYLKLPHETANTIKGDWLFTGDIAKIDEEGYAYIVDRKKDMIISHGMNIYPREVEDVMREHPSVEEAAVVGKKDSKRGEVPVAMVVLKKGMHVEAAGIINFLKQKIADYKIPHLIEFRQELPKTPTGKVLKRILKEEVNHS